MTLADWVEQPRALDGMDIQAGMPELIAAYTPNGFRFQRDGANRARLSGVTWELEIHGNLLPPGAPPDARRPVAGRIERVIHVPLDDERAPTAEHIFFEIPDGYRARGLGSNVLLRSVEVYQQAGIPTVTLDAGMYGRYVWAMCAFEFASAGQRDKVVAAAQQVANRLHERDLCPRLDFSEVAYPWEIARVGGTITLEDLAACEGQDVEEVRRMADHQDEIEIGKAILLGDVPLWKGRLDIRPGSLAVDLLRQYAERDAEDEDLDNR